MPKISWNKVKEKLMKLIDSGGDIADHLTDAPAPDIDKELYLEDNSPFGFSISRSQRMDPWDRRRAAREALADINQPLKPPRYTDMYGRAINATTQSVDYSMSEFHDPGEPPELVLVGAKVTCSWCGSKYDWGATYCPKCGAPNYGNE